MAGFSGFIDTIFDPIFGWLLNIPPIIAIIFLSLLLGLVSTLLQKWLTDQAKMRRLKDDTKKIQKQMREAQKAKQMDKAMKLQQKLMPIQLDLMKESFRPLIWTMLPFLLIFFWLSSHFAYYPVTPNEPFTVTAIFEEGLGGEAILTGSEGLVIEQAQMEIQQGEDEGKAVWNVRGGAGEHDLTLAYAGASVNRKVLITGERDYVTPKMPLKGSIAEFNVDNAKLIPIDVELFGWKPGWIFWYIILSIPISLLLKKLLNVV